MSSRPRVLVVGPAEPAARCRRILAAEREFDLVDEDEARSVAPVVVLCVGPLQAEALAAWRTFAEVHGSRFVTAAGPELAAPALRVALRAGHDTASSARVTWAVPSQEARAPWPGTRVSAIDVARLAAIPWLSRVGRPLALPRLSFPVVAGACAPALDAELDDALLESVHQVSAAVQRARSRDFASWNEVVRAHRESLRPLLPVLEHSAAERGLGAHVVVVVESVLLTAMIAGHFRGVSHRSSFAHELVEVLAAGHLPVAWRGRWPAGSLVVA